MFYFSRGGIVRKCFMKVKCIQKSLYQPDDKECEVSLIYDRGEIYGSMEVDGYRRHHQRQS